MPKELTHWAIALNARDKLPRDSALRALLKNHEHAYLLGAIAYDIPYYYLRGPSAPQLHIYGHRLHGASGYYPHQTWRALVDYYHGQPPYPVMAFFCGCLCHRLSDITCHPLVNYYSGRHDFEARHRTIETLLDLSVAKTARYPNCGSLGMTWKALQRHREIYRAISLFLTGGPDLGYSEIDKAMGQYCALTAAFRNPLLSLLVWPVKTVRALCYPFRPAVPALAELPVVSYRHPVTGEEKNASLAMLLEEAANSTAGLLRRVEDAWIHNVLDDLADSIEAVSLDTGLPASDTRPMWYFDEKAPLGLLFDKKPKQ